MEHVATIRPTSVLDVGVGFGKWGVLFRELLDVTHGRYRPDEWKTRLDGIEGFTDYGNQIHDSVYTTILYEDIRDVLSSLEPYDLIFMGDVIEHFEMDEGRKIVHELLKSCRYLLVATPILFFHQSWEVEMPNELERHKSFWTANDFQNLVDYEIWGTTGVYLLQGSLATDAPPPNNCSLIASRLAFEFPMIRNSPTLARALKRALIRARNAVKRS